MVEIAGAYRVRMQLDAAEVDDPGKPRRIIDHEFFRSPTRRERQRGGSQPRRTLGGRALLIKRLAFGAINESLENDRAILDPGESARRDGQVVADEIEFRELCLSGKIRLVRVCHADFALPRSRAARWLLLFPRKQATPSCANLSQDRARPEPFTFLPYGRDDLCVKRNGAHVQKLRKRRIAPVKYLWPIICASSILEICSNFLLAKSTSRYFVEKSQQ